MRRSCKAFTLAELLVSVAVLTVLVLIATRMINSAATITTLGSKRMDADSQVRPILDRMAVDFSQMIRRSDVDYYAKSVADPQPGNDRIAFFSNVSGYYPTPSYQSPLSLVSYRINSDGTSSSLNRMQRMSKGLIWNAVSPSYKSILFGSGVIATNWPAVTDNTTAEPDYELVGPQIFRFEYFFLLKTGLLSVSPGAAGMQDVAAISVAIATMDQKSRLLLSEAQVTSLAGRLKDFDAGQPLYDLTQSWQASLDGITDMPRSTINGVRIYQRYLYLRPSQ